MIDNRGQFVRFLVTGGFAAFVNIASRVLLSRVVFFELAVLLAYGIGMLTAYLLFRSFVFGHSGRSIASESYRFVLVNGVAASLVLGVSVLLARVIFPSVHFSWHAQDVAHVIAVGAPMLTSYVGHRNYTFNRRQ